MPTVIRLLKLFILLLWPLVQLSQWLTSRLSGGHKQAKLSREEFKALADIGSKEGALEAHETKILKSLFRFRSLQAKDIMTPRVVMFALPQAETAEQILSIHKSIRFSRIPIYDKHLDDITGYVLKDEILLKVAQDEHDVTLQQLKRPFAIVHEILPLPQLFDELLTKGEYIALVLDQYGGLSGIVTIEDIVETILGLEIVDEADSARDMQNLARKQWEKRALKIGLLLPPTQTTYTQNPNNPTKEEPNNERK